MYKNFENAGERRTFWELNWRETREHAHRIFRMGNYQFTNDIWFPKDLQQGDVVQCLLPTQKDARFDAMDLYPRNCFLLGIDVDRYTAEPLGLKLVRFSYNTHDSDAAYEYVFDPRSFDYRFKIHGFRKDAVLRTGRIEYVPFDSQALGYYLNRSGWLDASVFREVDQYLDKGYAEKRQYREHRPLGPDNNDDVVCVPSLNPVFYKKPHYDFSLPDDNAGLFFDDLSPEERAELIERLEANYIVREFDRPGRIQDEKYEVKNQKRGLRDKKRDYNKLLNLLNSGRTTPHVSNTGDIKKLIDESLMHQANDELKAIPEDQDMWGEEGMVLRRSDITPLKEILYARFGLSMDEEKPDLSKIFRQSIDRSSINDLVTLGIGGLMREPEVRLPEHLWQGRYLMLRIADLHDPQNESNAYRPCAVWKAYAKLNADNQPVLAGLELHPCTRKASGSFAFKYPVHPFGWRTDKHANKMQSFLIADMVIRLPVNAVNFQIDQVGQGFHELLPRMVNKFAKRIEAVQEASGGELKIFGLQEVPEDWVEIDLPQTPEPELQAKLAKWGKATFIPSSSPEIKPMRGSRHSARSFKKIAKDMTGTKISPPHPKVA